MMMKKFKWAWVHLKNNYVENAKISDEFSSIEELIKAYHLDDYLNQKPMQHTIIWRENDEVG